MAVAGCQKGLQNGPSFDEAIGDVAAVGGGGVDAAGL